MNLNTFLHSLHRGTNEPRPPDEEIDWEDAPFKYKLYRGLPAIPLSPEVPLSLEELEFRAVPDLEGIGHFLWYVFGLAQLNHAANALGETAGTMQLLRRFIPSGGGLYPNELYIYLRTEDAPSGVYHYDAAHHRLVLLREGNFDSYVERALGNRCDISACFGTVFVSTVYWKNFFKYRDFAYRLQGLDTGILLGQLLEMAKRFGYSSGVYFQFLDRSINHLLGLSEQEETVYAVVPLSAEPGHHWFMDDKGGEGVIASDELCRELPAIRHENYERSRRVKPCPMLVKVNEASILNTSEAFRKIRSEPIRDSGIQAAYLPRAERRTYDLASACRKRYSPDTEFVMRKVTGHQLSVLLQEATASFSYRNDLDRLSEKFRSRVAIFGCLYQVEGIPDGAYRYDSAAHALRRIRPGDHRSRLQRGMSLDNVSLFQVPLCLHVAGNNQYLIPELGYRGYRILQMEAGMLVQRLLLTASGMELGGRPLLGFNTDNCDDIYRTESQGMTSLIQIPIGYYRHRPRLEGGLHC